MSEWTAYSVQAGLNGNLGATLRVAPDENASGIAIVEHTLPSGKLAAPLHRHSNEDEISFILEGTMGVQEGETVTTVEAGEVAVKERGTWHTFWNPDSEPLRFLEIIAPGEFARYFEQSAQLQGDDELSEEEMIERFRELHEQFDFELDPESVPALLDRHGVER